ncbi:MAG: hypothetical protein P4L10_10085 [Acidobacteriaceae bacterium]|nr:hypothetical protein [Acidobacteriaceae bacterium]
MDSKKILIAGAIAAGTAVAASLSYMGWKKMHCAEDKKVLSKGNQDSTTT